MKKIGIVNYHYSNHNYGAVLQAAALHSYVNNIDGFKSEHINYIPPGAIPKWNIKFKNILNSYLMDLGIKAKKITHGSFRNPEIFENFRVKWLPRSEKTFHYFDELKSAQFDYSHVIVGSDQVWRPSYTGSSSLVYFLSFLNSEIKKISYAASFGNDTWDLNEEETLKIASEVNKFQAVSVRESSGVDICETYFSVSAQHVLDPTLLVGRQFFDDIIDDKLNDTDKGIVFYKLDVDGKFESFINEASSELNLTSTNIYYTSKGRKHYYREVDVWLKAIRDSKLVITDSFHCVCFAILFEKPFLFYPNENRGVARLESLLGLLDLEQHIYRGDVNPVKLLNKLSNIDYVPVKKKLEELRLSSSQFLYDSIK